MFLYRGAILSAKYQQMGCDDKCKWRYYNKGRVMHRWKFKVHIHKTETSALRDFST